MHLKNNIIKLITPLLLTVSIPTFAAPQNSLTTQQLQNLIECKSDVDGYHAFGENYEQQLKQLGWQRKDDANQPFLYIYKNKQPLNIFGHPTQEIALAGQGVVAVYRNTDYRPLAKELSIQQHPEFVGIPLFRGEKIIKTEPATADRFTFYHKLVLSEMTGKSPMSILGCTYEPDRAEVKAATGEINE